MIRTYSQPRTNPISISIPISNITNINKDTYYNSDLINNPLGIQRKKKRSNTKNSKVDTFSNRSRSNREYSLAIPKLDKKKNCQKNKESKSKKKSNRKQSTSNKKKLQSNILVKTKSKNVTKSNCKLHQQGRHKINSKKLKDIESQYGSIQFRHNKLKKRNKRSETCISKDINSQTRNQEIENSQFNNQPLGMRSTLPIFIRLTDHQHYYFDKIRMVSEE